MPRTFCTAVACIGMSNFLTTYFDKAYINMIPGIWRSRYQQHLSEVLMACPFREREGRIKSLLARVGWLDFQIRPPNAFKTDSEFLKTDLTSKAA